MHSPLAAPPAPEVPPVDVPALPALAPPLAPVPPVGAPPVGEAPAALPPEDAPPGAPVVPPPAVAPFCPPLAGWPPVLLDAPAADCPPEAVPPPVLLPSPSLPPQLVRVSIRTRARPGGAKSPQIDRRRAIAGESIRRRVSHTPAAAIYRSRNLDQWDEKLALSGALDAGTASRKNCRARVPAQLIASKRRAATGRSIG